MYQCWENLLFAHWRVEEASLRRLVPAPLELDTYDGSAWVAVTPFEISRLRILGIPPPGAASLFELNVRTYVTHAAGPGVFFFTLEATSALAVLAARLLYGLPYHRASISASLADGGIRYRSRRAGGDEDGRPAFEAEYGPISPPSPAPKGTLPFWLTERYRLYTVSRGAVRRVEIEHPPWPLQEARARIERNDFFDEMGVFPLIREPILHFARRLDVRLGWPLPAG